MKKIFGAMLAVMLVVGICTSAVSAHSFTATGTNTEVRYHVDGVYVGSEYSWGNDNHPVWPIYEYETISEGMYHDGTIPKANVESDGPYGTITPTGISSTITYHNALYHGWVDCSFITIWLGETNEHEVE